ncbi:unnamed protein product, partial [marine sediment metagenome]
MGRKTEGPTTRESTGDKQLSLPARLVLEQGISFQQLEPADSPEGLELGSDGLYDKVRPYFQGTIFIPEYQLVVAYTDLSTLWLADIMCEDFNKVDIYVIDEDGHKSYFVEIDPYSESPRRILKFINEPTLSSRVCQGFNMDSHVLRASWSPAGHSEILMEIPLDAIEGICGKPLEAKAGMNLLRDTGYNPHQVNFR